MRIGEVASRTAMSESALRAWERRFGLLEPRRSPGGQRRYSEADVERVLTVRRLVADGLTLPSAVARVRAGAPPAAEDTDAGPRKEDERQARFRAALLEAVGEAVVAATPEGVLTYVNPAAARMFGWPANEVVGVDAYSFPTAVESAAVLVDIHAQVSRGERYSGQLPMVRRDGGRFVGHLTAAPVLDDDDTLIGMIGVIRDITEELRRDRELLTRQVEGETVAMLGARALTRDKYTAGIEDAVIKESVEATRRVLQVDSASLVEMAPGGTWTVRATAPEIDLDPPVVLPGGSRSLAGYTALARTVIVVEDAETERRFELSPLCPDTRSAIAAPVFGPRGVRAVLAAASSKTNAFDDASHFAQAIANVVGAALQ